MVVYITRDQLQFIMNHARSTYPEECCGFLLGRDSDPRIIGRALSAPEHQSRFTQKSIQH